MRTHRLEILSQVERFHPENSAVIRQFAHPYDLADGLTQLSQAALLNQENFEVLIHAEDLGSLVSSMFYLSEAKILSTDNIALLVKHPNLAQIAIHLYALEKNKILSQQHFLGLITHSDPGGLVWALNHLNKAQGLNPQNANTLIQHPCPRLFAQFIFCLEQANIFNQAHFSSISLHPHPHMLFFHIDQLARHKILNQKNFSRLTLSSQANAWNSILSSLIKAKIFNRQNWQKITRISLPHYFSFALKSLEQHGLLNQSNFAMLMANHLPSGLKPILSALVKHGMLNQKYLELTLCHADQRSLVWFIFILNHNNLLNTVNLQQLLDAKSSILLSAEARELFWKRLPKEIINQRTFSKLLMAAEHPHPLEQLDALLKKLVISDQLSEASYYLRQTGPFDLSTRRILRFHPYPYYMVRGLALLKEAKILNPLPLLWHTYPLYLVAMMKLLMSGLVFNAIDLNLIARHRHPRELYQVISCLKAANILTLSNFKALFCVNHTALFTEAAQELVWDKFKDRSLTQDKFEQLLVAAEQKHSIQALETLMHRWSIKAPKALRFWSPSEPLPITRVAGPTTVENKHYIPIMLYN